MSKVDKKLADAKCNGNFVKACEQSLNVVSVVKVHDEIEVTFKRNDGKHIFPTIYGREAE